MLRIINTGTVPAHRYCLALRDPPSQAVTNFERATQHGTNERRGNHANFRVQEKIPYVFGICGRGNVGLLDALARRSSTASRSSGTTLRREALEQAARLNKPCLIDVHDDANIRPPADGNCPRCSTRSWRSLRSTSRASRLSIVRDRLAVPLPPEAILKERLP